jgi:hypothetical protein
MPKFNNLEDSLKSLININNLYANCVSSIPDKFSSTVTVIDKPISCTSKGLTISGHVIRSVVTLANCGQLYKGLLQLDEHRSYTYVYLIWSTLFSGGPEPKCYYTFIPDNKFADLNDPKNLTWFREPRLCLLIPWDITPSLNSVFTNVIKMPAFNGYKFSIHFPISVVTDLVVLEKEYFLGTGMISTLLRDGFV